jgi:AraC-like DNA-binding protein
MIPRSWGRFLPKRISVLTASNLLVAALQELPVSRISVRAARLRLLAEIIRQELKLAEGESFGVTLPRSPRLAGLVSVLLKTPEDSRRIDDWADAIGVSRRAFTRLFVAQTGSSFGAWKRNLLLGKALNLLADNLNVSQVADRLGYANPSAFILAFRRKYGASPRIFTRGLSRHEARRQQFDRDGTTMRP